MQAPTRLPSADTTGQRLHSALRARNTTPPPTSPLKTTLPRCHSAGTVFAKNQESTSPAKSCFRRHRAQLKKKHLQIEIPSRPTSSEFEIDTTASLTPNTQTISDLAPGGAHGRFSSSAWWPSATSTTSPAKKLINGVGRLLRTPKTAITSARRMLRCAPFSPAAEDLLTPSAAGEKMMWLQIVLDHDLATLVSLTGNGRLSWFMVALRLDLSNTLQINPRHLKILSVTDSPAGMAEIEFVLSVPVHLEDEYHKRLDGIGRALVDQVNANQLKKQEIAQESNTTDAGGGVDGTCRGAKLCRDLPLSRTFLTSGMGGSSGSVLNYRADAADRGVPASPFNPDDHDDATYVRGGEALRDFDLRHRPRALNVCEHIHSVKVHASGIGRAVTSPATTRLGLLFLLAALTFALHMCGAFVTVPHLPLRASAPGTSASPGTVRVSEFVSRSWRTADVDSGSPERLRGKGHTGPLMLEPLTVSALVFVGAEKAFAKMRGKGINGTGTGARGVGGTDKKMTLCGGAGDAPEDTSVSGGGIRSVADVVKATTTLTRGATLMHKREAQKHRRKLQPVAALMTDDPLAGTATLLQMGKHKIAEHMSHGDEEDPLEEQVNEDLMEMMLDKLDQLSHMNPKAAIKIVDAVQPLVHKLANAAPHAQQMEHLHLSAHLHSLLHNLQTALGHQGGGLVWVGVLVGLGLSSTAIFGGVAVHLGREEALEGELDVVHWQRVTTQLIETLSQNLANVGQLDPGTLAQISEELKDVGSGDR